MNRTCSLFLTFACLVAVTVGCSNKGVVVPTGTVTFDTNKKENATVTVPEPKKHAQ